MAARSDDASADPWVASWVFEWAVPLVPASVAQWGAARVAQWAVLTESSWAGSWVVQWAGRSVALWAGRSAAERAVEKAVLWVVRLAAALAAHWAARWVAPMAGQMEAERAVKSAVQWDFSMADSTAAGWVDSRAASSEYGSVAPWVAPSVVLRAVLWAAATVHHLVALSALGWALRMAGLWGHDSAVQWACT